MKNNVVTKKVFLLGRYQSRSEFDYGKGYFHPLENFFFLVKWPSADLKDKKKLSSVDNVLLCQTDEKGVFFQVDETLNRTQAIRDFAALGDDIQILSISFDHLQKLFLCAEIEASQNSGQNKIERI